MKKSEVIHSSLIRPIAELLVPENISHFRLLDDPDSDNLEDYEMNGEKVSLYDDKLLFTDTGAVFTLTGDILSIIIDYVFDKTDSTDAKQSFTFFLDEMHFDIHAKCKSSRDKNLIKKLKKNYTSVWVENHFLFRKSK